MPYVTDVDDAERARVVNCARMVHPTIPDGIVEMELSFPALPDACVGFTSREIRMAHLASEGTLSAWRTRTEKRVRWMHVWAYVVEGLCSAPALLIVVMNGLAIKRSPSKRELVNRTGLLLGLQIVLTVVMGLSSIGELFWSWVLVLSIGTVVVGGYALGLAIAGFRTTQKGDK